MAVGGYVVSQGRVILESRGRAGLPHPGVGCSEVSCEGLTVTAQPPGVLSRRSLVKGVIAALSGLGSGPLATGQEGKAPGRATDAEEIAKVEKLARDAGLGPLHNTRSAHFLAVGDAPESHLRQALDICEALGEAFLVHFRGRGLTVEYPDRRLTVIALRDQDSYAALLGEAPGTDTMNHLREHRARRGWSQEELARRAGLSRAGISAIETDRLVPSVAAALALAEALECRVEDLFQLRRQAPKDVGGHYDLETNRLVIFDFRPQQQAIAAQAARVNLFTLVHETAHQLSFNTGILNRQADVPVCVSEGLATYVELWRPGVKNAIGGVNRQRMQALRQAEDWIQIGDLLADDTAFEPKTAQLAYAESWLLVHYLLRASSRQPRFRQYLAEVPGSNKPADRTRIAEKTLGPLAKLDHELKDEARKYLRG